MKIKAILFAAAIFGASFFVNTTTDNDNDNNVIKKTAIDVRKIKIPSNG